MKSFFRCGAVLVVVLAIFVAGGCRFQAIRLNMKGQIYIKYEQFDKAEQALKQSFDFDFENSASHYWLGRCYELQNRHEKAVYEYGLAVRFTPGLDIAQMALIKRLHRNGKIEESAKATDRFLEHKDSPARFFISLAESFAQEQMDAQAILAYQKAQKNEPRNPRPSVALAEHYLAKQNEQKEVDALIRAFQIDPFYPGLAHRLGQRGYRIEIPEPESFFTQPSPMQQELKGLGQ